MTEFVEKEADADLIRAMRAFAAERIMDAEVAAVKSIDQRWSVAPHHQGGGHQWPDIVPAQHFCR